ncbi:oplophorus-luciferin 2-monooxygenase non-catalytic subunit [Parasteatoda tepidariorum]|uniref:oplophorus-luciferin 2-monooxygenase non-catalytic subunit n=1 Tax=Parasteatoda tepidariorum TaxID=114398 RepID=UPI00077FDA75|nr:connectin [Parasteatoda tepidariorum]
MIIFNIFILIVYLLIVDACPSQEDLYPCSCFWNGVAHVTCTKLENNHDLINAARSLVGKNYKQSITIQNSVFNFIPSDAFKGLKVAELEIQNSTLMALTDADFAFEGLEDYLQVLRMENFKLLGEWSWSVLSKLNQLKTLEIKNGELENIEDLGKINLENLNTIDFTNNGISFLHDNAFANSRTVRNIIIRHNEIAILKRTMLPNPAIALVVLNLSYNKIEQFPDDMFSLIPHLKYLDISHNKILVLSEKVFAPIWSSLIEFKAMGNELRCDCRMSWILQSKKPQVIYATCAMPQTVRGKSLSALTSKDLWCIY